MHMWRLKAIHWIVYCMGELVWKLILRTETRIRKGELELDAHKRKLVHYREIWDLIGALRLDVIRKINSSSNSPIDRP